MGCDRVPGWSGMSGNAESGRASAWLPISCATMLDTHQLAVHSYYTTQLRSYGVLWDDLIILQGSLPPRPSQRGSICSPCHEN